MVFLHQIRLTIYQKRRVGARRQPKQLSFENLSSSEPIMRAIIENMISPDCVLCYVPRVLEIFRKEIEIFWK